MYYIQHQSHCCTVCSTRSWDSIVHWLGDGYSQLSSARNIHLAVKGGANSWYLMIKSCPYQSFAKSVTAKVDQDC